MDGITKQTRRQSYDGILPRSGERCKLILETLGSRQMTVEEITDELVAAGHLKYYDRNFVAPRLTELKAAGILAPNEIHRAEPPGAEAAQKGGKKDMIALNILLGLVAAVLLLGVIAERDKDKNKNITIAFVAVVALIIAVNFLA